jgi:hypothetical protein
MTRYLPLVAAIALVIGAGAVRARWTSRQADLRDVLATAARLENVPVNVGEWVGTAHPFDLSEYRAAGIQGALLRTYRHKGTGQEVTLMIVCGRPGPISVHTPDVCYPGSGYRVLSEIRTTINDHPGTPPHEFWKLRMNKVDSVVSEHLNVTYGWSFNGHWQAPQRDAARFVFASAPVLFKLYVQYQVPPANTVDAATEAENDPTVKFLEALLPKLNRALFPPPEPAAPASETPAASGRSGP